VSWGPELFATSKEGARRQRTWDLGAPSQDGLVTVPSSPRAWVRCPRLRSRKRSDPPSALRSATTQPFRIRSISVYAGPLDRCRIVDDRRSWKEKRPRKARAYGEEGDLRERRARELPEGVHPAPGLTVGAVGPDGPLHTGRCGLRRGRTRATAATRCRRTGDPTPRPRVEMDRGAPSRTAAQAAPDNGRTARHEREN